ncbi:MAG TPA: hypothetical protein QKA08_01460 [Candidatus Megaira endosymbiont of Nemacystus decipiens]|nr:hypothetical protein [Candidatus Megaera endosymbiont of Nemacystus decipiens]
MFSIIFIISNKVVDFVLDFLHRGSSTGLDSDKQNLFNQKDNLEYNLQDSDLKILGEQDEIFISHSFSKKNADWKKTQFTESINNAITKAQNNPNKTSFGIYNQDGEHWVAYALVCKNDDITILYKDSKTSYTIQSFRDGVKSVKPEAKILVNNHQEQEDVVSCGMFSLENTRIMKEQLSQNSEGFIEKFENFQDFYKTENISELRQEYGKKYLIAIANAIAKASEADSKYVMKQTIDNLNISGQPELSEEAKNILIEEGIVIKPEPGFLSSCFSRLNEIFDSISTSSENISENNIDNRFNKPTLPFYMGEGMISYKTKSEIINLKLTGETSNTDTNAIVPVSKDYDV